jgi:hypothetical protein
MAPVMRAVARSLAKGGLALLVVGGVLVMTIAWSPFGSEPESVPVPLGATRANPGDAGLRIGMPHGLPCATVSADVDYRPYGIVVRLRTTFDRPYGGPDIFGCTLQVELDEEVGRRPILDGWCLEALPEDTPENRVDCRRGVRTAR